MNDDSTKTIYRSAAKFFLGTFLSRISGMLRDMAMAFSFGTSGQLATFLMAFRFSNLARRLFGEGSLQSAFIPHFEKVRSKGAKEAIYFFRDFSLFLSILLIIFILLSMSSLYFFGHFFEGYKFLLTLTLIMMPSLFFMCLYGLNTAFLECEKSFFTPSVAPVAFNAAWIAASLILAFYPSPNAMQLLSMAVIFGSLAQWVVTIPHVLSLTKAHGLSSFWEKCHPFSVNIRAFLKPFLLANVGVAASQINNALDPVFAYHAAADGPAWLWYAIRLQQFPLSLFGIALSGALLPSLSRAMQDQNLAKFKNFLHFSIIKTLILIIPITFALFCMGSTFINLVFGRGQFQAHSIIGTTHCLWGYGAGLLPMVLILLLAPAFYASGDYKTPMRASVAAVALNILLNSIFVFGLKGRPESVAWATSLAAWFNFLFLLLSLNKKIGPIPFGRTTLKIICCSLGGMCLVFGCDYIYFKDLPSIAILQGKQPVFSSHFSLQSVRFAVEGVAFVVGTMGMAWITKTKEMSLSLFNQKERHLSA